MTLTMDKSAWGPGPWQDEPDQVEWQHPSGLACTIVRNHVGSLCGYVGCPEGHPLYGQDWQACGLRAHGGVNFASTGALESEPGKILWFFGFDCSHSFDDSPVTRSVLRRLVEMGPGDMQPDHFDRIFGEYRDLAYVREQVDLLAEQIQLKGAEQQS